MKGSWDRLWRRFRWQMAYEAGAQQMLLNGENVTGLIRTEEVSRMASISSAKTGGTGKSFC